MKLLLLLVLASAFPTFVRQVHAQQSPFVMPPFSFSTPAAVALFLTLLVSDVANSNTGRILVQAVPDFRFVGNGACQDGSSSNYYDYIGFVHGLNGVVVTSKDDCERLCVTCACEVSVRNTNRQFRGFAHTPNDQVPGCFCYFDDDPSNFSNECENIDAGKGFSESPFVYVSNRAGNDAIVTSNNESSDCWATVTIFDTSDDCPSDAPSESPSDAPSESPSDAPVIAPSESPSDTPSKSASPTAKASKHPKGPKSSKMPKSSSSLQTQAMKSGGSPSFSPLSIVGVCGMFAVITFIFVDLI
eukprot:scaffold26722_cov200-Skeletonema_menzelii.AAC.1